MSRNDVKNAYFHWLYNWMSGERYHYNISFKRLLMQMHDTEFVYTIRNDQNRAEDGVNLRYRFAKSGTIDEPVDYILECLARPCSVLEMIVALANRCEEDYMDDPAYGDRTAQWFWGMISNLKLGNMLDAWYDKDYVEYTLQKFLHRDYAPDGTGGLFRVRGYKGDMRKIEIWHQMCYFLDTFM